MSAPSSFSWMPTWLRKFLNLDDELPRYGPSSSSSYRMAEPSAPSAPRTVSYKPAQASSYTPPTSTWTPTSRSTTPGSSAASEADAGSSKAPEGYIQPVSYVVRSYARGMLPPQGLEQFTREVRATLTDVWNFYSYWTRFQTDAIFKVGREIVESLPGGESGTATSSTSSVRRIKVAGVNGNGEKKVSTTPEEESSATTTPDEA